MNAVNDKSRFCTSVLLESPIEAQLYFDKLPGEHREAFKEYPKPLKSTQRLLMQKVLY